MPTMDQAARWFAERDPVHGFDHVLRVYRMAERIAMRVGADLEIVRAAALLHDAVGSAPSEGAARGAHHEASAAFARTVLAAEGWPEVRIAAVEHCIRAHRFRHFGEQPQTLEAQVLFDADKLDVLGAFGAARTIAYAVQAGQPVFALPSARFLASGEKEDGEPHSAYHEFLFKLRHVRERLYTEEARRIAQARHHFLARFFEQLAAEADGRDG